MSVQIRNVKDTDRYWERLSVNLSYLNRFLRGKAEYGSEADESGVQRGVLFAAEQMAKEHDLNVNLVSALCRAVALCFPTRGLAELAVIKEFINKNNMAISLETLETDAIEYAVDRSGSTVTPELDTILRKYYADDESVSEVNLVRFLQKYLNLNREVLRGCAFSDAGQVVDDIMKRAKEEYEKSYRLLPDPTIPSVPQSVKEEIEGNVSSFIEYHKDICVGIYEVII